MPSFDRPPQPVTEPSAWVGRFCHLIPPGGGVLDLACGDGRHARYLGARGHRVTAVDLDISGLGDLVGDPTFEVLALDLEDGHWPFAGRRFAGIVVTNYLHRPHLPWLAGSLVEGGTLLMETFAAGNERHGRPRNPAFLLEAGELLTALAGALQVVAYEHGLELHPRPAVRQRICAVRTSEPQLLP